MTSPFNDPQLTEYTKAQIEEYSAWKATSDIYHGNALAYRAGDPVPASNVKLHGYDKNNLVEKVGK